MSEWWNSIPSNQKLYWFLSFPFTALFIIQSLMTFIGLHNDTHTSFYDGDTSSLDIDDVPGIFEDNFHDSNLDTTFGTFKILTLNNIIIFFTIFSWSGIVLSNYKISNTLTFIIAIAISSLVVLIISSMFYFSMKLTENGTLNLNNALHCTGEVYLTIPENKKDTGKVTIILQGRTIELDAITNGDELITGTKVVVINVINNQLLLVEKYN